MEQIARGIVPGLARGRELFDGPVQQVARLADDGQLVVGAIRRAAEMLIGQLGKDLARDVFAVQHEDRVRQRRRQSELGSAAVGPQRHHGERNDERRHFSPERTRQRARQRHRAVLKRLR